MSETVKDFDYDAAIKKLRMTKSDHESESRFQDYLKEMSYLHGAYFVKLQANGFSYDEAFELLKIWSNNITKKG